jgi:hypothetical protein
MWNFLIITVMLAATGVYTADVERNYTVAKQATNHASAETMALYRAAVVKYYTLHSSLTDHVVTPGALKGAHVLPDWFPMDASTHWANYRDASGTIYIFPLAGPVSSMTESTNIVNEVIEVSQNSSLVGVYRASDSKVYFPIDGGAVSTSGLNMQPIADGSPVWIATIG